MPQIFSDNPKFMYSLSSTALIIVTQRVLNAGPESTIHQYYGKFQARKGISELGYAPDSVTLPAPHTA